MYKHKHLRVDQSWMSKQTKLCWKCWTNERAALRQAEVICMHHLSAFKSLFSCIDSLEEKYWIKVPSFAWWTVWKPYERLWWKSKEQVEFWCEDYHHSCNYSDFSWLYLNLNPHKRISCCLYYILQCLRHHTLEIEHPKDVKLPSKVDFSPCKPLLTCLNRKRQRQLQVDVFYTFHSKPVSKVSWFIYSRKENYTIEECC